MSDLYRMDDCKLLYHMDRVVEHYDKGRRIYPLLIDLAVTKFCNISCNFCYGIKQDLNGAKMSKKAIVNIYTEAPQLGVKALALIGDGENTLNPAMYDGIEAGAGRIDMAMATNGVALDDDKLKFLIERLTWLRFTVSAASREGYQKIHGKDFWHKVERNMIRATEIKRETGSNCTLGIQTVLTPLTFDYIEEQAIFALKYGFDYYVIKQFSDPGDDRMSPFNQEWYQKVHEHLKELESMSTARTQIIPKWETMKRQGVRSYDHCVDCPLLFQISGNGKCYPCGYLFGDDRYCYGDLEKQTLKEILDSERYWEIIEYMRYEFDVHKDCQGGCRHDASNIFISNYLNKPQHLNFI